MTATGDSGRAVGDRAMGLRRLTVLGVLTLLCVLIGGIGARNARPSSGAATTWKAQDASTVGKRWGLVSVTFADAAHGWAVGVGVSSRLHPLIVASSDGGATWKAQDASSDGNDAQLQSVTSIDARHAWAVGYAAGSTRTSPVILATSDGGATWKAQDASTAVSDATLTSVTFSDAAHGWAVGYGPNPPGVGGPVILATSDGGATWKTQDASSVVNDALLFSVTATDATHAWAVGERLGKGSTPLSAPVILATTTGGGQAGPKLTLKLSDLKSGALKLGKSVTTKGTATPTSLAGSKVTLTVERMSGGAWRKVKSMTAQIAFSGAYGGKFKPAKKGSYRVRARVAKTVANTAAATGWRTFKVR